MTVAKGLFGWFAQSVRSHPSRLALEAGDVRISYAELDDLSRRLAARLAGRLGEGTACVGLVAARTPLTYAAYLAISRCGGTVVPINPAVPVARSASAFRALGVEILLSDRAGFRFATSLRNVGAVQDVIDISGVDDMATLDGDGGLAGPPSAKPTGFAYALFTSGTTGRSKGVPISNASVDSFLNFNAHKYSLAPGDRVSQVFDLSFDPSIFDMFNTWGAAATLVVPSVRDLQDPATFVARRCITHWFSVPSLISLARDSGRLVPGSMPDLQVSLFGGEALSFDQARAWRQAAPNSGIENLYGPTEITVACAGYRLPLDEALWPSTSNGTVPIGAVYPHLQAVLVDGSEVSEVEGELCLRGPQRFGGYVNPSDNGGRFLDVFGNHVQGSDAPLPDLNAWYRTGDRVRVEDGLLVHLGRTDDQVKVLGHRVELGEIEAAIRGCAGITEAAVAVVEVGGEPELVAIYTGVESDEEDLVDKLRRSLPMYMLPAQLRHVPAMPLSLNGKLDRGRVASLVELSADRRWE